MPARLAAVLVACAVLGACGGEAPAPLTTASVSPSPPRSTVSPAPPPVPDPRQVPVATLLREDAFPEAVLYGEMDGVAPEEIVVLSSVAQQDEQLPPIPYLDAFAWDPGGATWARVFDATTFHAGNRGPVLAANDATGQTVPALQLIDFADDGTLELVVGAQTYGASAGPVELGVLSRPSEAFEVEFYRATERGGEVSFTERTVTLETGVYRAGDPGCCPSAFETLVIGWDAATGRVVVLERTEKEATQG